MGKLSKRPYTREDMSLDKYLQEIGRESLVTREQESKLAKLIRQGSREALENLVKANLRFVVSVAKQYQNQGMSLCDLINEGNVGLIKAATRFDETKGFKFISYAVWWIRQSILQSLAEQSRIVRIPLNRVGALHKISKASRSLEQEFGRTVTLKEVAEELDMKSTDVVYTQKIASRHLSLDAPFDEYENGNSLQNILEDHDAPSPDESILNHSLCHEVEKALSTLTDREAEVISLYFGINRTNTLTLEEIGKRFRLTRERVRQIKEKALNRLRHPSRSRALQVFVKPT